METRTIMGELLPSIIELTKDKHGNYVVQSIIKNGSSADQTLVIERFKSNLLSLSLDKFASNVVEITLRNCTLQQKRDLVSEFLREKDGKCALADMVKHEYGNYVIQKMVPEISF